MSGHPLREGGVALDGGMFSDRVLCVIVDLHPDVCVVCL